MSIANAAGKRRLTDGLAFDRYFVACCAWILLGVFVDGWAHARGFTDDTFFTPWHAVLYSGFFAALTFVAVSIVVNRQRGFKRWDLLPAGYELTLLGLLMFGVGGFGDMIWHELFGVEADLEAITSPTHLLLAVALGFIVSGPVRAAWLRLGRRPQAPLTLAFALTFLLTALAVLTLYAHPLVSPHIDSLVERDQELGMASILLQTGILMAIVFMAIRRWDLPPGTFLFVFALHATALSVLRANYPIIIVMMIAGGATDLLNVYLKPGRQEGWRLRLFAFLVPVTVYLPYFLMYQILGTSRWVIHLWAGGIVMAGIAGWLISYLMWPPPLPIPEEAS